MIHRSPGRRNKKKKQTISENPGNLVKFFGEEDGRRRREGSLSSPSPARAATTITSVRNVSGRCELPSSATGDRIPSAYSAADAPPPGYYAHGYQAVPGYAVAKGRPVRERRLPCCGFGFAWFLFIIGFFLAAIPWYVGAIILLCVRSVDHREKPGYIACTVAAERLTA
ncbi:unnamed protein product [Camellia sinensis]